MSVRSQLRGLGRFDALALTAAIWFLGKFLRYAFPPLFEPFQETYHVSNAVLGVAFTGFMIVYAGAQFPSGLLADRVGSVRVIVGGVLLASIAAFAVAVELPFVLLVTAMLAMGAGTGAHKTVAVRLLSRAYPARTGRALGIFDTVGTFGGVVAPLAVVAVASAALPLEPGWRVLFFAAGLAGVAVAAAFGAVVPRRLPDEAGGSSGTESGTDIGAYVALFREHRFAAFVLLTLLSSFAYNGTVAFAPLYLTREAGLSSAAASLLYSALFVVSLVQLATGELSDRIGTLPVIVATLGLEAVGLAALVALTPTGSPFVLGAAVVVVGVGAHGFRPVRGSYLMETLPASIAGGSFGIVRTLLMGAGAVAPATVGILSDVLGFRPAFWILAGSIAGAAALSVLLWITAPDRSAVDRAADDEPVD